ncbi:MAG: helix-turn-helix domain-containing protein [Terriglobia bacterium]
MAINVEPNGLFSNYLFSVLNSAGLSIRDLAEKADVTYESARRFVNGTALPGKYPLRAICKAFDLDLQKIERLVLSEKIRRKYGDVKLEMTERKASLTPIEDVWDFLSPDQQKDLIYMAKGLVKRNRESEGENGRE